MFQRKVSHKNFAPFTVFSFALDERSDARLAWRIPISLFGPIEPLAPRTRMKTGALGKPPNVLKHQGNQAIAPQQSVENVTITS